jgi:hypothetical protein
LVADSSTPRKPKHNHSAIAMKAECHRSRHQLVIATALRDRDRA